MSVKNMNMIEVLNQTKVRPDMRRWGHRAEIKEEAGDLCVILNTGVVPLSFISPSWKASTSTYNTRPGSDTDLSPSTGLICWLHDKPLFWSALASSPPSQGSFTAVTVETAVAPKTGAAASQLPNVFKRPGHKLGGADRPSNHLTVKRGSAEQRLVSETQFFLFTHCLRPPSRVNVLGRCEAF